MTANREWMINRDELASFLSPRAVRQFEEMQAEVATASEAVTANVDATARLTDATVITLSPNADLANERVLSLGEGLEFELVEGGVIIRLKGVPLVEGGFPVRLVAGGDTEVVVPLTGILATRQNAETLTNKTLAGPKVSGLATYADNAAALAGGLAAGALYLRTGHGLDVVV